MLAIARALIVGPDVLIVDEPALGLAPALVDEVYDRLVRLAHDGLTVVLLEQLLSRAMSVCHEVVVLHEGVVAAQEGPATRRSPSWPRRRISAGPGRPPRPPPSNCRNFRRTCQSFRRTCRSLRCDRRNFRSL